ncbi:hypothetical protein [Nocardia sp. BMG111209]|uniref:hypothetical protein n=1 Tax=Nocardia sp. BMG111209 TaxID=1160137 RepID=UPI0003756F01|nr:hypothetical protein [Nocardia sp. BMG111209]
MGTLTASRHDARTSDTEIAPLAEPALVLGAGMLAAAVACVGRIPGWADDYGAFLVFFALILHLALAVGVLRWGWQLRQGR